MSQTHNIPEVGDFVTSAPAPVQIAHVTVGPATTNDVVVGDIAVYTLFNVDEPIVIKHMWTQIETAFTASVTLDIGDTGSAGRYTSDTTIVPGTTGAVLVADTGLSVPYLDSTPLDIELTVGGATVAAGLLHVYVEYALLRD